MNTHIFWMCVHTYCAFSVMYAAGPIQMTPSLIKTKENDGINHCLPVIIVIRPLKVKIPLGVHHMTLYFLYCNQAMMCINFLLLFLCLLLKT